MGVEVVLGCSGGCLCGCHRDGVLVMGCWMLVWVSQGDGVAVEGTDTCGTGLWGFRSPSCCRCL